MQTYLRALDTDAKRIENSLAHHGGYYFTIRGQGHSNSPISRCTPPFGVSQEQDRWMRRGPAAF